MKKVIVFLFLFQLSFGQVDPDNEVVSEPIVDAELFENLGDVDYEDLLLKSKKANKSLMIFFRGYACANCNKIEKNILLTNDVYEKLKDDFLFVTLYVDDKHELNKEKQYISSISNKLIVTIGEKNIDIQKKYFNTNYQPNFIIVNNKSNQFFSQGYTSNKIEFLEFIKTGLK